MQTRYLVLALLLWLPAAAIAQDAGEQKFRAAITALEVTQIAAYNKHDAATVASVFTDDAVSVTPGGVLNGRESIEKRYAALMASQNWRDYEEGIDEAHLIGTDAGWAIGHWTVTATGPTGEVRRQGLWSAVYMLDHAAWKARMDTVTILLPPPAPAAGNAK
jgi:uncharacterized protein (TIGR02246 family)